MSPQAKSGTKEAASAFVAVALDEAWTLREEYGALLERRKANRDQLRSLQASGYLSAEQVGEVEELYPKRDRKAEEAEESQAKAA